MECLGGGCSTKPIEIIFVPCSNHVVPKNWTWAGISYLPYPGVRRGGGGYSLKQGVYFEATHCRTEHISLDLCAIVFDYILKTDS